MIKLVVAVKGSSKSGNYGHAGIPGHLGGSAPKGVSKSAAMEWASGTQVADENGKPLMVYHGTNAKVEFDQFAPGKPHPGMQLGFGIHFTPDQGFAKEFYASGKTGRVIPCYLKVNKLLKADGIYYEGSPEFALGAAICKAGRTTFPAVRGEDGKRGIYLQNIVDRTGPKVAERVIRQSGYDGVQYNAQVIQRTGINMANRQGEAVSYVVFDPSQIKMVAE